MFPAFLSPARCLVLTAGLLVAVVSPAQRCVVRLSGVVTEHFTGDPLRNAVVRVLKAGNPVAEVVTRNNGRYAFELDRGWRYTVYYSRKGMVTKHVVIDTQGIPPYPDVPFYEMDVQMTLFGWIADFDLSAFDQALGEAAYAPGLRNMSWDVPYTEELRPELSRVMTEYEKTAKGYYARKRAGRRPQDLPVPGAGAPTR
ncbi:MAG TPA: carboxypeptidase-like regulatory domain-containing protein [Flavobacteriales bacterium]